MLSQEGVGVKAAVGLLNWCQNGMAPPDQMRLFEMNICSYIEPSNRIPDYSRRNRLVNHFESQHPRLCTCYSPPPPPLRQMKLPMNFALSTNETQSKNMYIYTHTIPCPIGLSAKESSLFGAVAVSQTARHYPGNVAELIVLSMTQRGRKNRR